MKKVLTIAAAIGIVGAGVGVSVAATSSAPATVKVCVNARSRAVTQPVAGKACPAGSFLETLSKQNTPGPQGPAGVTHLQADEPYGGDANDPNQDPNPNIIQSSSAVPADSTEVVWVACPVGKTALGGGFRIGDGTSALAAESEATSTSYTGNTIQVLASESAFESGGQLVAPPKSDQVTSYGSYLPNAWAVTVRNTGSSTDYARADVICADVTS